MLRKILLYKVEWTDEALQSLASLEDNSLAELIIKRVENHLASIQSKTANL